MRKCQERIGPLQFTAVSNEHRRWTVHGASINGFARDAWSHRVFAIRLGDYYLDLAGSYLYVRTRATKADGTILDTNRPLGPVNNWLDSLFNQVDISLNDTVVTHFTCPLVISVHSFPFDLRCICSIVMKLKCKASLRLTSRALEATMSLC